MQVVQQRAAPGVRRDSGRKTGTRQRAVRERSWSVSGPSVHYRRSPVPWPTHARRTVTLVQQVLLLNIAETLYCVATSCKQHASNPLIDLRIDW